MNTGQYGANAQYRMGRLPENTQVAQGPGRAATPMPTSQAARDQERLAQLKIWNEAATKDDLGKLGSSRAGAETERRTDNYHDAQEKNDGMRNEALKDASLSTAPPAVPNFEPIDDSDEEEEEPPKQETTPASAPPQVPEAAPAALATSAVTTDSAPPKPAQEPAKVEPEPAPTKPAAAPAPTPPPAAKQEKSGCCIIQ
uniref:Uncharacterized protein n=1 Tax=Timspurckia oligopyrenoides TaxID=708627 RepID=A0A7S0ZFL3_9RHOD|mmetsp:Transcript_3278/g.5751  ORF Transcript_3278/g.5751 Transcript_3278/m.5751 type:complete len:199 (+) Transcript_3278:360-956(+)|eukprot:CAMPEP_0182447170 /NCGR_PEP_ID=MMETSP1172-20130603/12308_1 /TAXON_ID=708627 /ORGANISM="Timspurckia oligopyrenoides, Strain CCMP3278" /LENGTH=198 /DNA_ID=CAMNT_0024643507 /DNA_START=344 /DNA_END=940 /DNA_ORIENTATION=-